MLRGAGTLEPSVARHDLAGRVHPARGRNRPDRADRRMGVRQACMDAAAGRRTSPLPSISRRCSSRIRMVASVKACVAGLRPSGASARTGDHGIGAAAKQRGDAFGSARASRLRRQDPLDDFGTGYSSLSYLRSFPFDKIKIDRSFVSELATREDSMAIVRAVTGLGKSLGMSPPPRRRDRRAVRTLAREGCTQAQGYLFSPPRPVAEVETMLSRPRARIVA